MSKNKELEVLGTVQHIGNSWVVCKSKSRKEYVYYFNTKTGETAWNLSDAEIEKAKKSKPHLDTHHRGHSPRTPEHGDKAPSDSSVAPPSVAPVVARHANNHINNIISSQQVSNIPFQGFIANNATFCGPVNNCTSLSSLNQYQFNSDNLISSLTNILSLDNVQQSMYNPNVWALPQQQFLITPLVNGTQASANIGYNNTHRPVLEHPAPDVHAPNATTYFTSADETVAANKHSFINRRQFNTNQYKLTRNIQNNDLRQKLTAQRRLKIRKSASLHTRRVCNFDRTKLQRNQTSFNVEQSYIAGDVSQQNEHEETPSKLDLTPLKRSASSEARADFWLIVVDADVLLTEFKFINVLCDSDGRCRLVVPRHVMSQLEHFVCNCQDMQVRHMLRFLTTQIRHGHVLLGDKCEFEADAKDLLLSTCFKLHEEKYHTILLTNDTKILMHKDANPFSIFTPEEVKIILKDNQYKNSSKTKPSTFIPNRLAHTNHNKSQIDENASTDNKNKKIIVSCDASVMTYNEEHASLKKTVDAEIQTDFSLNTMLGSSNNADDKGKIQDSHSIVKNIDKGLNTSTSHNTVVNTIVKSRKIKLKRSDPTQSVLPMGKSNEKRNFKWHRRRNEPLKVDKTVSDNTSAKNEDKTKSQESESTSISGKKSGVHDKSNLDIANSDVSVAQNYSETIIEETSTSKLISTNNNSKANENNDNREQALETRLRCGDMQLEPILYKVDSPGMAECLKVKCDEWVSRFIQTMEEVLSVVLHRDPIHSYSSLPPPWTIRESVQCIKLKFNNSIAVRAAVDNFLQILFKVSNDQGKINDNIKPSEYMEMYSYGVNLLNTLQGLVNDCEDLQIATESLKKLLVDIQNPNMCSMNKSYAEISHDPNLQISNVIIPEKQLSYKKQVGSDEKEESYNLRSTNNNNRKRPVRFVRNLDPKISFFKILHLKENNNIDHFTNESKRMKILDDDGNTKQNNFDSLEDTDNMNTSNKDGKNASISDVEDNSSIDSAANKIDSTRLKTKENLDQSLDSEQSNKSDEINIDIDGKCSKECTETKNGSPRSCIDNDATVNEPKIIRNFSKCAVFEEKLKNKLEENLFDDNSVLDYEEDYQYTTEGYGYPNEFDGVGEYEKEKEVDDTIDDKQVEMKIPKETETLCYNENVEKFKFIIGKVLQQIKEAFISVQTLCEKYFEESQKPFASNIKRIELQVKAENAHSYISNLCTSLDRMLMRETGEPNNNIEALWKKYGDEEFRIDEESKIKYRNIVAKCKCHAEVFLESIKHITSALKY